LVKDFSMNFVTIDFSLNSPGICIFNDKSKKYHFISYVKKNGSKKAIKLQEELGMLEEVTLVFQPNFEKELDYSSVELGKIKRYDVMSNDIINLITQNTFKDDGFMIAFEGVSYGSKGGTNNIIDMASAASILKIKLLKYFKPEDIQTVSPATIKKHAGKGNMNKRTLWDVFVENRTGEEFLEENNFWKFSKKLEVGKSVPKPFDDLVDAFYLNSLLRTLKANLTSPS
jgi:hypothetical protein